MIAVIFEVSPADGQKAHDLDGGSASNAIAYVVRDYGMNDRDQARRDSRAAFSCKVPGDR